MDQYLQQLSELALIAGRKIMQIYVKDFKVDTKQDTSPVTEADRLAEEIIVAGLKRITPNIAIIAEEMAAEGALPKLSSNANESFYLVDPLDGTKEFIHKRGEFTVNIALIKNHKPIIGIIFAPTLNQLYVADVEQNYAQLFELNNEFDLSKPLSQKDISTANIPNIPFKILASRSHINAQTEAYIEDLRNQHDEVEIVNIGSSLKLCLLAAGEADIYPRFGPTMEWDIAAGHAILSAAGGYIKTDNGDDFTYGDQKNEFRNGNFIAYA
ncbi:MAG: 3'(2'),5'-bisphosphate nucleotidase [Hyphomicrobiales bacterium]|nr:MAG: 3'(2'),5'-bisphosphate nucleotidase [Hyphomicrobiales bacterium]